MANTKLMKNMERKRHITLPPPNSYNLNQPSRPNQEPVRTDLGCRPKRHGLIGTNSGDSNGSFLRQDVLLEPGFSELSVAAAFIDSELGDSCDRHGHVNYLRGDTLLAEIRALLVYNFEPGSLEVLQ